MEHLIQYDSKSIQYIKILFRIFLGFLFVTIAFLFLLKMNDTVPFNEGLIYSNNPQIKINAPNEVRILKVNAKEGQTVAKGDTLLVLENLQTKTDLNIANLSVKTMRQKINSIKALIATASEQKAAIRQLIAIQSNIYSTDKKKTEQEINNLNSKISLSNKQSNDLTDRYKTDSILYAKGAISKLELSEQNNKKLEDRKNQSDINSNYQIKVYDYNNLANNFNKTNNDLKQNLLQIDNQIINYKSQIIDMQSQIESSKYNLEYFKDEVGKLIVIAPFSGTISNVFNTTQNRLIVSKDETLTVITPLKESFYAKVSLPEKDLIYVKTGQQANLKLDAYNYYQFGAIKGTVTYVSQSDSDRKYYCIVKLNQYNKNINLKAGYNLKGEIIVEEMRLNQYIIKKLLNSYNK